MGGKTIPLAENWFQLFEILGKKKYTTLPKSWVCLYSDTKIKQEEPKRKETILDST